MPKNYELLFVIHPDLEGTTDKVSEKITQLVDKNGGKVTNLEDWGKKRLAYKIKKNEYGVYVFISFSIDPESLRKIENSLRLSEEILRFMVEIVPEVSQKKRKKPPKEVSAVTKQEPKEEEKKAATEVQKVVKVTKKAPEKKASEEKTEKKPKKAVKATTPLKKEKKAVAVDDEKTRMKKLDEKLEELLK